MWSHLVSPAAASFNPACFHACGIKHHAPKTVMVRGRVGCRNHTWYWAPWVDSRGLSVVKRCLNVSGIHTPIESRENPLPKGEPLHISLPLDPTFCEVNVHVLHPFLKAGSSPLGILFSDIFSHSALLFSYCRSWCHDFSTGQCLFFSFSLTVTFFVSCLRNLCLFRRNADVLFCFPLLKTRWQTPHEVDCTKPQVTKLRLNHSFCLSRKWNLEPTHQESPDQQSLAHGWDKPVAPKERDPATTFLSPGPSLAWASPSFCTAPRSSSSRLHGMLPDSGVVQKRQYDLQNLLSWILFFNGSKTCFFLSQLHLQSTFMHEWGRGQDTRPSKQLCTDWTPLTKKASAL